MNDIRSIYNMILSQSQELWIDNLTVSLNQLSVYVLG